MRDDAGGGAFKGTGLSIMTDVLCGMLTSVALFLTPDNDPTNLVVGHILIPSNLDGEVFDSLRKPAEQRARPFILAAAGAR